MEKAVFVTGEHGETESWYILASTTIAGTTYILVCDAANEDEAGQARILKEKSTDSAEVLYEDVTDEKERDAVADIFEELMEETDTDTDTE